MSFPKRITSAFVLILFLAAGMLFASAAEKTGSIQVEMEYRQQPLAGGTLTLYRVADRTENGDYALYEVFRSSGVVISEDSDPESAKMLARYASENAVRGTTLEIDETGTVRFSDLHGGLYLVVQQEPSPGFLPISPFLVSIPTGENGYDLYAAPKCVEATEPEPTSPKPDAPQLPQTGQLNWPIPVMILAGLGLYGIGWYLIYGKKDRQ